MTKRLRMKIATSALLLSSGVALADPRFATISTELTCKTGKSGTETVVVSGQTCFVGLGEGGASSNQCVPMSQTLNAVYDTNYTALNLQNSNIPCAKAEAAINAFNIFTCFYGSGPFDENALLTVLAKWSGTLSPTTTIALGNGNIATKWNTICEFEEPAP